jgi:hypothetical protein
MIKYRGYDFVGPFFFLDMNKKNWEMYVDVDNEIIAYDLSHNSIYDLLTFSQFRTNEYYTLVLQNILYNLNRDTSCRLCHRNLKITEKCWWCGTQN